MKNTLIAFLLLIILVSAFTVNYDAQAEQRDIILITEYRNMAWGMIFEFGALDNKGNLWIYNQDGFADIPYETDKLLEWAENTNLLEKIGQIDKSELNNIKSLVSSVTPQDVIIDQGAFDAGLHSSFVFKKNNDKSTIIVLGFSGSGVFENTNPEAQRLYEFLNNKFTDVTSFNGEEFASRGFLPISISEFCGYGKINPNCVDITSIKYGCGSGPVEVDITPEELLSLKVIGKYSSLSVNGEPLNIY